MKLDRARLTPAEIAFIETVDSLRDKLDAMTMEQYARVNPLMENLCDWRERGERFGGKGVVIHDSSVIMGEVVLGEHCWVGPGCLLDGSGGLKVGRRCTFSAGVHVYTHDTVRHTLSDGAEPYEYGPVSIGDCTFIGAQSVILKGVTIGAHCLIGANSTITHDLPAYSIAAGTPTRVIGKVNTQTTPLTLEFF
ncbi:MAG: acyltransferase [Coriobacteriales bacterium]|jgi:acetyltransferase-like isoleucine patch superfamily enzyme|nr:acyltransferase [Coriobacteriales bacterium]